MERRKRLAYWYRGVAHSSIGIRHLDDSECDDNRKCNHYEQPSKIPNGTVEIFSGNAGCESHANH